MLTKATESIRLQTYVNMHNFHIPCTKSTTPNKTQIDHMWTNVPTQQCHVGTMLEQHKLIRQIITLFTLHLNYLTIFVNLLYQPLTNKC